LANQGQTPGDLSQDQCLKCEGTSVRSCRYRRAEHSKKVSADENKKMISGQSARKAIRIESLRWPLIAPYPLRRRESRECYPPSRQEKHRRPHRFRPATARNSLWRRAVHLFCKLLDRATSALIHLARAPAAKR